MRCVTCGEATRVLTTYQNEDGRTKRRRECVECKMRFTTREHPEINGVEIFARRENRAQLELFERQAARASSED